MMHLGDFWLPALGKLRKNESKRVKKSSSACTSARVKLTAALNQIIHVVLNMPSIYEACYNIATLPSPRGTSTAISIL